MRWAAQADRCNRCKRRADGSEDTCGAHSVAQRVAGGSQRLGAGTAGSAIQGLFYSIASAPLLGASGAPILHQHRPSDSFVGIDTAKWLQPLATRLFNRPSQTLIRLRSSSLRQSNLSSICCILPDHINYFTYSQEIVHPESSSLTSFHVVGHRRTLQAVGWFRSRRPVLPVHPCTFGTQGARSIWHRNR